MKTVEFVYKQEPHYEYELAEVIKLLDDLPHLLLRVKISGPHFELRAQEPVVRILRSKRSYDVCWFADIAEDQQSISAYFPLDVSRKGMVEYGYGNTIHRRMEEKLVDKKALLLDRKKIQKDCVLVTKKYLEKLLEKKSKGY